MSSRCTFVKYEILGDKIVGNSLENMLLEPEDASAYSRSPNEERNEYEMIDNSKEIDEIESMRESNVFKGRQTRGTGRILKLPLCP